jgi:Ring finger domain/SWIM zinc finger
MSDSTEKALYEESQGQDRKGLQQYLKANGLPATGTTAALRQSYLQNRRNEHGLTGSAAATNHHEIVDLTNEDSARTEKKKTRVSAGPPVAKRAPSKKAAPITKRATAATEKRLKVFRSRCSAAVQQRIQRAKTQRLYLVQPPNQNEYTIMGSTGNIYTVTISNLVNCTCPDHAKGHVCKHILFVMLKVVGLPDTSPLIYQAALVNSELQEISQKLETRMARMGGGVMANARVQQAYRELTMPNTAAPKDDDGKRQPIEGDCPICFDDLLTSKESLVYCRAVCGANFHAACMDHWKTGKHGAGITCPNCRSPWEDANSSKIISNSKSDEGYANLGALQGQSATRDTSTYSPWGGYQNQSRWCGGRGYYDR